MALSNKDTPTGAKLEVQAADSASGEIKIEGYYRTGDGVTATFVDPDTNIRFSMNPVQVKTSTHKGSWLDCQIKAGLIIKV